LCLFRFRFLKWASFLIIISTAIVNIFQVQYIHHIKKSTNSEKKREFWTEMGVHSTHRESHDEHQFMIYHDI